MSCHFCFLSHVLPFNVLFILGAFSLRYLDVFFLLVACFALRVFAWSRCPLHMANWIMMIIIFSPTTSTGLKHCTKQGMTATVSYRSKRCWGRWPHFRFGALLKTADIVSGGFSGLPVINVARLPIFWTILVPPVFMATGKVDQFTAAPLTLNSLPPAVLNCDSLSTFQSRLKTHLFSTAFC